MVVFNKYLKRYKCAQLVGQTVKLELKMNNGRFTLLKVYSLVLKMSMHKYNKHENMVSGEKI